MAVDGGITAAIDDAAAVVVDLEPVAVTPGCGLAVPGRVHIKVARQIALVAVVTPEVQRHARYWSGAHQFAPRSDDAVGAGLGLEQVAGGIAAA